MRFELKNCIFARAKNKAACFVRKGRNNFNPNIIERLKK